MLPGKGVGVVGSAEEREPVGTQDLKLQPLDMEKYILSVKFREN